MSFRIPSLEEARKKQENSIAKASVINIKAASSSATNSNSNRAGFNSKTSTTQNVTQELGTKRAATASTSKVFNPYAKKKKTASHNPTVNPSGRTTAAAASAISFEPCASSFSQAFSPGSANAARSGCRPSDALDITDQTGASLGGTPNIPNSLPETPPNVTPRDNHAYLQPHVLHVSTKQRGNGMLRHIRNVPCEFSKMTPDFIMGTNRCALFLSLKYHNLHPNYVHRRIAELEKDFDLRVLLCLVDLEDNAKVLLILNKVAVLNNMTLVLAWSNEEAARYLETYKSYESKDATTIQKKESDNFPDQVSDVLSTVRSVNKTDSSQLLLQFGTLKGLIGASIDELSLCPGMGEKKVKRLYDAFHKPFSSAVTAKRRQQKLQKERDSIGGDNDCTLV